MSLVAMLMIHNPSTLIWGDEADMIKAKEMLSEVKESIINAYEVKTNLPRNKISKMMDNETWMSSNKAVELGFADKVLYEEQIENILINNNFIFDRVTVINTLINKFPKKEDPPLSNGTPYEELSKKLNLIK